MTSAPAHESIADSVPTRDDAPNAYWRGMDGGLYEEMIRERERDSNRAYLQQETFLREFMLDEQRRLDRPLRVLEFGCGFGRHARYLSDLENVLYYGYDFSESMQEPLRERPPRCLEPISQHLFTGPDVKQALDGRRFDIVFTVSVLIHNPPERVPVLVQQMASLLNARGAVCLIENELVSMSVFENYWHQGCWLHSYPELLPDGYDVFIGQGIVETHDIYVLRPRIGPSRFFRLQSRNGSELPLSRAELDTMGLPKLRNWARSIEPMLRGGVAQTRDSRVGELEERLRAEERRAYRRRRLARLADELGSIRAAQATENFAIVAGGDDSFRPAPVRRPAVLWNEPVDTRWAHGDSRFARVVHVFHQEWHGIRASAGYLPGLKLAITCQRRLTADELRWAIDGCAERLARTVLFHGYSDNADELAFLLRDTFGGSVKLYAVWLGNTAQLHLDFESDSFMRLLQRRRKKVLDGLACVKPDMHLISDAIFNKALLSVPPVIGDGSVRVREWLSGAAFIPVPNDWRKNFYTNLFAARRVERLRDIFVTTRFRDVPDSSRARVVRFSHPERAQVFRLMRDSDVILNASLSECYPMTALEGLSLGTPCLTGPLSLGELDAHPFQKLCQVRAVDSVREVKESIDRVLDIRERHARELEEMMADYSLRLTTEALQRHGEFLKL
jgi:SAM-dependent methyltransferase